MDSRQEFLDNLIEMEKFPIAKTWRKVAYEYIETMRELLGPLPIENNTTPVAIVAFQMYKITKMSDFKPVLAMFSDLPAGPATVQFINSWQAVLKTLYEKFLPLKEKLLEEYNQIDFVAIRKAEAANVFLQDLARINKGRDPKDVLNDMITVFKTLGWDTSKFEKTKEDSSEKVTEKVKNDGKEEIEQPSFIRYSEGAPAVKEFHGIE